MSVIGSSLQRFQEAFSIVVDKGMLNVPLRPPLRNIYEVQNSFPFAILWHPLENASFINSYFVKNGHLAIDDFRPRDF